jgi:hypothetical protein
MFELPAKKGRNSYENQVERTEHVVMRNVYAYLLVAVLALGLSSSEAQAGDCVPSVAVVDVSPKASVIRTHRSNPTMMRHYKRALAMRESLYERLRAGVKPHCSRADFMSWFRCASPKVSASMGKQLSKLSRGKGLRTKQLKSLRSQLGVTTVILYSMKIRFHDQRELEIRLSSIDLRSGTTKAQVLFAVPYLEEGYDEAVWPGVVRGFLQAVRDGSGCDIEDLKNDTLGSDPDWLVD